MPPPIGPLSPKQRKVEEFRRLTKGMERSLRKYFKDLLSIRPAQVTPEFFADLQAKADDVDETIRMMLQNLYDIMEIVSGEPGPLETLQSLRDRLAAADFKRHAHAIGQIDAMRRRLESPAVGSVAGS